MADRRILVTGGTGYFGARLSEHLNHIAHVVVTHRSAGASRAAWLAAAGVECVPFDSASATVIPGGGRYDAIINLAMPGAAEAGRQSEASMRNAVTTARACLNLLEDDRAGRLIHFSTFHVYGGAARELYDEADVPEPGHPYGRAHLEVERLLGSHPARGRITVLRPTNMVGAPAHADIGDQAKLLFVDLCRQAANGTMRLNNDGLSYRDILPFEDAFAAIDCVLAHTDPGFGPYNLSCGEAMRLDAIAALIVKAAPHPVSVEFGSGTDAYRHPFRVSNERLRSLGWTKASAGLGQEISNCIRFYT